MRVKVTLACTECKQRNYVSKKNKKNDPDRIEMMKHCKFCRKHTLHNSDKKEPNKVAKWFKDLKIEFKKVVWPTKQTVLTNTSVVLAVVAGSARAGGCPR